MALRVGSTNREIMRRMNESSVIGIIHDHGPIARTEIATATGLSLATISKITSSLIDQSIVIEQRAGESTGGRPPILLDIDRVAALAMGIKLTESRIIAAVTDLGAQLIDLRVVDFEPDSSSDVVIGILSDVMHSLMEAHQGRPFIGAGVGMAGIIDRASGVCRYSPVLGWRNIPIRDILEHRLGIHVIVENDVNALTVAERWFGTGATSRDFLVVTIGRGVGMGIVLNGELYRGSGDGAGEFGHVAVTNDGPLCACGNVGCVEAYVGEPALSRAVRKAAAQDIPLNEAVERARRGNEILQTVFRDAGSILGRALSGVVSVLNPSLIIIGGEGVRFVDLMMPSLESALAAHCFANYYESLQLVQEGWGDDGWARGAAALAVDAYFHPFDTRRTGSDLGSSSERRPVSLAPQ